MVKKILLFVLAIILLTFTISSPIQADNGVDIHLEFGKNEVQISSYVYASELIEWNPDIEYISYYDEFLNRKIAYVNVFGGIGDNFLTGPNQVYEVSVKKNTGLILLR